MIIMKFGGSSVRDAERIREVKKIIAANLADKPVIVFSAMGKTTDQLIQAGKTALTGEIDISIIKDTHLKTVKDLKLNTAPIEALLTELTDLLKGISLLKELSKKTHDYLVSFGERLAVRIIAAHLTQAGI